MVYQLFEMMRDSTGNRVFINFNFALALALALVAPVAVVAIFALGASVGCSGTTSHRPAAPGAEPGTGTIGEEAGPTAKAAPAAGAVTRPTKKLTVVEARRYMVALLNRDRATAGLAPVELDEGAPTTAGQAHAEDMAHLGYLGHWGSDGSVPEQRHSEAGGADMVLENALCFTDEAKRTLDPKALIDPVQVERAESMFFDEVPPNDGHRKNILKPGHTKVGIGVAQPVATATEIPVPCFAQELTDGYGVYAPLPKHAKVGAIVRVEGTLSGGAKPSGVGVARIPRPAPIKAAELNKRRSYPVPKPFQMYWGPGFVTPLPVKIDGPKFAIDVPLSDKNEPGLYEVSVWATLPGESTHAMVSVRTIVVD